MNGALLLGLVATLCQLLIAIYIDQRLPWKGKRTDTDDNRMEMYEFRKTANNIDPTDVDAAEIVEGHAATANDGRRSLSQPVTPARQSGESRGSEPLSGTLAALARTPPVTSLGGAAAAADGADVASDEAGYAYSNPSLASLLGFAIVPSWPPWPSHAHPLELSKRSLFLFLSCSLSLAHTLSSLTRCVLSFPRSL